MEMISFMNNKGSEWTIYSRDVMYLKSHMGLIRYYDIAFKIEGTLVYEQLSEEEYNRLKRELTYRRFQTNVIGL